MSVEHNTYTTEDGARHLATVQAELHLYRKDGRFFVELKDDDGLIYDWEPGGNSVLSPTKETWSKVFDLPLED